jgi:large subunit ribosomal protein L10
MHRRSTTLSILSGVLSLVSKLEERRNESLNKEEKQQAVSSLREKFSTTKIALLTDYRGLTVSEMTVVRKKLRDASVEYRVVKNNLAKIALEGTGMELLKDHFEGPTAVALSYDDVVAPAKILSDAAKKYKKLEIRAGILEGSLLNKDEVARIASLPSREELLGMFLRALQGPLTGFAGVLSAPLRNLANALNAVKDKKAAEA